jgi:hypothetical protein
MRSLTYPKHLCSASARFKSEKDRLYEEWRDNRGKGDPFSCGEMADPDSIFYDKFYNCWVLDNDEYATPIFFCPWCGRELKEPTEQELRTGEEGGAL